MGGMITAVGLGRSTFEQLDRWRWLLWYHRPEQLARRLCYRIRDRVSLRRSPALGKSLPSVRFESLSRWADLKKPTVPIDVNEFEQGKLTLLNLPCELGWPIKWASSSREAMPPLWEFQLQYQEYLLGLCGTVWNERSRESGTCDERCRSIVQKVVTSWLDRYEDRPDMVAWHPYCISRRIWVWMRLLAEGVPANADRQRWITSLVMQIRWLERRLERDLGGNHLWENARAMAAAGIFFKGEEADRWWNAGRELLDQCLGDQLLPWGEHFERSPMYQADLGRGLAELSVVARVKETEASDRWRDVAGRMNSFLSAIRHPDGTIPLFGDSSLDAEETRHSSKPAIARDKSEWIGEYYVHRVQNHQLIFDAGNMGPDELPAHSHADLLGFELSAYGQRLMVDSGVHSYSGAERTAFRATTAHNVLVVDDAELADTWSSFRMGRRGHVVKRDSGRVANGRWVVASHDGYSHLGIGEATRVWFLADEGLWFCVDLAESSRTHDFASLVHWAPHVTLTPSGQGFVINGARGPLYWQPVGDVSSLVTRHSSYADRFYTPVPNERWEVRASTSRSACVGWMLALDGLPRQTSMMRTAEGIQFCWTRGEKSGEAVIRVIPK